MASCTGNPALAGGGIAEAVHLIAVADDLVLPQLAQGLGPGAEAVGVVEDGHPHLAEDLRGIGLGAGRDRLPTGIVVGGGAEPLVDNDAYRSGM